MPPQALPEDLIKPVLEQLEHTADLCRCARVSQAFHQSSVVVLYRNLHVRDLIVVSIQALSLPCQAHFESHCGV